MFFERLVPESYLEFSVITQNDEGGWEVPSNDSKRQQEATSLKRQKSDDDYSVDFELSILRDLIGALYSLMYGDVTKASQVLLLRVQTLAKSV